MKLSVNYMAWCLTKQATDKFLKMLKSGEINPAKLASMTSAQRREFFAKHFGEVNAKNINSLFESKLLLKNQKRGMITWAKRTGGLSQQARRDIITRINKLERVLDPKEEQEFLEDLAAQKLGIDVTEEEAKKIFELAQKAEKLREKSIQKGLSEKEKKDAEIAYGNALIDFAEYKNEISPSDFKILNFGTNLGNLFKTIMSSVDVSMYFRQGWGMMSTKEFWGNFPTGIRQFLSEKSYKDSLASILGHPNFEKAKSAKLGITKLTDKLSEREEAFQSSLIDKLPLFRGSQRAFTGFLNKVRFDRFNALLKQAELAGEDVGKGSQTLDDIAEVVNSFTGRGRLGKKDRYGNTAPALNLLLFSPRKITATIDMFNPAKFLDPRLSNTARKARIRQLTGSLAMTVTALAFAESMGADVEKDPRSSDFGKAKIGNSRIDFTGGNATFSHLLARLLTGTTKSSTTGEVYKLGTGYKPTTRLTLMTRFARNKLSPGASFVANLAEGYNFKGEPISVKQELIDRMRPLIISSVIEMTTSEQEKDLLFTLIMFELFGFGVQTYE